MAELSRQYIKERIDHLRELAREKRLKESQPTPIETIAQEIFNPKEEKIVNLAGDTLPF